MLRDRVAIGDGDNLNKRVSRNADKGDTRGMLPELSRELQEQEQARRRVVE